MHSAVGTSKWFGDSSAIMLSKLADIFRSDEFISSSEVFPDIDKGRIAKDLNLAALGQQRGRENLPETEEDSLDHVEFLAVSRVDELRRRGLQNFETNRRVYSERLNKAVSARMMVETEANDAKARFAEEVTKWKSMMVTPREDVQETFRWRRTFRERNRLERPAKAAASWPSVIGFALIMIVVESAGNAYLFAQNNVLGLLGGTIAAFLVSLANVSLSFLFGRGSRYANCRGLFNLLKKFFGLLLWPSWAAFAFIYNLFVAHFRDAVETGREWQEAGGRAVETLMSHPLFLASFESYLLLLLGSLISIVTFLKGYHSSDPYPHYSAVNQSVIDAREEYIAHLSESIDTLANRRDEAVETLRMANDEVHRHINDSVDALFGQKALHSNLIPFLEQCDIAVNYLLAVYRDANKASREADPPAGFRRQYSFREFTIQVAGEDRRSEAEAEARRVSDMVNDAIKEIFDVFHAAVREHYEIDELEGTYIARGESRPTASGAPVPVVPSREEGLRHGQT